MTAAGRRARPPCRPAPGSSAASTWRDHRPRPRRAQRAPPFPPAGLRRVHAGAAKRSALAVTGRRPGSPNDDPAEVCGTSLDASGPAAAVRPSTMCACAQSTHEVTSPRRKALTTSTRDGAATAAPTGMASGRACRRCHCTRRAAGVSGCQAMMSDAARASDSTAKPPRAGSLWPGLEAWAAGCCCHLAMPYARARRSLKHRRAMIRLGGSRR